MTADEGGVELVSAAAVESVGRRVDRPFVDPGPQRGEYLAEILASRGGLTLPSLVSAAVSVVAPQRFATGSGIVTMARQAGIALGIAILVTVLGQPAARAPRRRSSTEPWSPPSPRSPPVSSPCC